jgi:hypothetical protein
MNKFIQTASATALILVGAGHAFAHNHKGDHDHDKSDKRSVVASYDFSGFDSIDVEGVFELDIRAGDSFSVRTEATPRQAERLEVRLDGDTLILSRDDEKRSNGRKKNNSATLVVVTMPQLRDLDVAGVATGEVSAFQGGDVDVDVAGVGDLELNGTCGTLDIDVAGVGEVDARDLVCDTVVADMGGVGELAVHATRSVEADVGGIGEINVYGNPDIRDVSDGFLSKVRFKR